MPTYRDMGKMRGLTNYTTYASPNSKTIFFAKRGNNTHQYELRVHRIVYHPTIASINLDVDLLQSWCNVLVKSPNLD